MKVRIIIQARLTSSRLPGKALLPVAGYPSAILAALRGSNKKHSIIFATSDDPSDDRLVEEACHHKLHVFRGPLHDVIARYFWAAADLADESIVVRLTADNVLPDGSFVNELVSTLMESQAEYVGVDALRAGIPYGVSAEAFTAAILRKAHRSAVSQADREHVGLWMKRNCRIANLRPKISSGEYFGHLRSTIDTEDDYQRVIRLFEGTVNPLQVGWLELARKLARLPYGPLVPSRELSGTLHSELTLGTAQLGMNYGRVNDSGKPTRPEGVGIVRKALVSGVSTFDTARAYQESESVLGEALQSAGQTHRVVTKVDLASLTKAASKDEVRIRVDESIALSRQALRTDKLNTVLLHVWAYRRLWSGAVFHRLLEQCEAGSVKVIGASVYDPQEALDALHDERVKHLQLPINVLDRRWKNAGVDEAIRDRPDVTVHARSAFLQGILVHPSERWPAVSGFDAENCVRTLCSLANDFGRTGVADLCIAYLRSLPWITSVVIGCETISQLEQNTALFLRPRLTIEQSKKLESVLPTAPEELVSGLCQLASATSSDLMVGFALFPARPATWAG